MIIFPQFAVAWELIRESATFGALIFEDDIDFDVDTERHVVQLMKEAPANWHVIYFGHCDEEPPEHADAKPQIYTARGPFCSHAIAVSKVGAAYLLDNIKTIPGTFDDQLYQFTQSRSDFHSYVVHPQLFIQLETADVPVHGYKGFSYFPQFNHSITAFAAQRHLRERWGIWFEIGKMLENVSNYPNSH